MSALHQLECGALWKKTFQKCKAHYCILMCLDLSQESNYQIYCILAVTVCSKDSVYSKTLMETYNKKIWDLCFLLIMYYLAVSSCLLHSILSVPQFHMSTVAKIWCTMWLRFKQFWIVDKQLNFLSSVQSKWHKNVCSKSATCNSLTVEVTALAKYKLYAYFFT